MLNFELIMSCLISIYIFVLPLLLSKFKYKGIPINGDSLLVFIILFYLLSIIIDKNSRKKFINGIKDFFTNKHNLFMIIWVGMMFVSVIYAQDKKLALQESIRLSTYLILLFIIKYQITRKVNLNKIIYSTIGVGVIISSVGIYQYIERVIYKGEYTTRIFSTMENSNNLGALFVILIFPMIILAIKEKNKLKKSIYYVVSLLFLVNIVFSFSRNAWLGFIIGYITLIFILNYRLIYGLLIGGIAVLSIPSIFQRIKEIGDISQNLSRLSLWQIAVAMIKDHPILGVGNGNYRTLYNHYHNNISHITDYEAHNNFHPHNAYLKAQSELGIMGTISLLGFLITSFTKCNRFSNNIKDKFYKNFYKGFSASIIAFMFMNFVDNFFSAPKVVAFFFILLGILNCYEYNNLEDELI